MGINDEYSRDAYSYELAYDSDGSDDNVLNDPLHPEDWQDWYSEQLLNAWMTIRLYADENYIIMNSCYPDWINFVMNPSGFCSGTGTRAVPGDILLMWDTIKNIQVIRENVTLDNFAQWAEISLDIKYD
jgi:hypothetical protein